MKIHQGGWVHLMMQGLAARAGESGKSLKMLEVDIDDAYEGLICELARLLKRSL